MEEESLLLSQNKAFLKSLAITRGLYSGFNGRTISRMRKKDFIDYILLHPERTEENFYDPSLEEEITTYIFEALPPFIQLFENKKEPEEVRSPNEEDEPTPNLNIEENIKDKNICKILKELEIKITCVICQSNMRNVVFNPCNHLATCITCSKSPLLKTCPLCRSSYTSKSRIFF
jgi:hypothetical protein